MVLIKKMCFLMEKSINLFIETFLKNYIFLEVIIVEDELPDVEVDLGFKYPRIWVEIL